MIIEFFGFPGSGKTTVCNKFIKKLKKDDLKVVRGTFDHFGVFRRVTYKLFYSVLCFFLSPVFYLKNLLFLSGIKNGTKITIADFLNVTYLYARYSFFRNTDRIVVFDQGVIQAYWSILAFTGVKLTEYDYNHLFKNIDVVVILELDLEQNIERLFSREDQRSRAQKETKNMELYFDKFLMVKEVLKELDVPYKLRLDSGRKVKKNVKRIRKKIIKNKVEYVAPQTTDD